MSRGGDNSESNLVFQSAPLTDVRGDKRIAYIVSCKHGFQSAPLTDVRGDVGCKKPKDYDSMTFQSAPLTDVRGDSKMASASLPIPGRFNPLPSLM